MIEVFSVSRRVSKNDIITILPMQLVALREVSDDFSMTFFKIDKVMFIDIMSGLGKITPDFFFYMRKHFLDHLTDGEVERFLGFCRVVDFRDVHDDPVFRRETILHLLRIYFWDYYVSFQKIANKRKSLSLSSNKEKIALKFYLLVAEHYRNHREIAFYADKLCISPVYLSKVIQETTGRSPHEVIADHVVVEIKTLLRDPNLEIKDAARQTGFSNQSSLSRFFRQETGMSPSEYRRTIHVVR